MSTWQVLLGDVRERLTSLPAGSVQTCVTSPPYWGLRDYGHAGQLGLETTPAEYVARMVEVFAGVWRVLRDDGTLWLNLGDSYNSSPSNQHSNTVGANGSVGRQKRDVVGLKPKDLVGIPWMVAFALRDAGWYLRSDIIWHKPNPMPESVTDRPTKAHEYLFLLTKSARYYYDAKAIAEETSQSTVERWNTSRPARKTSAREDISKSAQSVRGESCLGSHEFGRNKRTVWTVPTRPYLEAHFATYPEALVEPCILAGSRPGDVVLDPFTGSGTTGAVAVRHQRSFVGCELNPAYLALARTRIGSVAPLLAQEVA